MKHIIIFLGAWIFLYILVKFSSKLEKRFDNDPNSGSQKIDLLIGSSIIGTAILGIIIIVSFIEAIKFLFF